jgi:hypothetical protein
MMAEYIEREAALLSLTPIVKRASERNRNIYSAVKQCVEAINWCTAADVAPIVRCKDCRHRDPEDHKCDSGEFERQGCPFKVADTYFCAYGERR